MAVGNSRRNLGNACGKGNTMSSVLNEVAWWARDKYLKPRIDAQRELREWRQYAGSAACLGYRLPDKEFGALVRHFADGAPLRYRDLTGRRDERVADDFAWMRLTVRYWAENSPELRALLGAPGHEPTIEALDAIVQLQVALGEPNPAAIPTRPVGSPSGGRSAELFGTAIQTLARSSGATLSEGHWRAGLVEGASPHSVPVSPQQVSDASERIVSLTSSSSIRDGGSLICRLNPELVGAWAVIDRAVRESGQVQSRFADEHGQVSPEIVRAIGQVCVAVGTGLQVVDEPSGRVPMVGVRAELLAAGLSMLKQCGVTTQSLTSLGLIGPEQPPPSGSAARGSREGR